MTEVSLMKVIYDLGANSGDDIPYYLRRADLVVAVEANPILCKQISARFVNDIQANKLVVENVVVTTAEDVGSDVVFYLHKSRDYLSQFPTPTFGIDEYEEIFLPSKSVVDLIREHGNPHYIKIDIEHYDAEILRALFENGIRPPYISAESHSIEIFSLFLALGRYSAFKLCDGPSVSRLYRNVRLGAGPGQATYSFPVHSAGPFGEDLIGEWMAPGPFFQLLSIEGLGWKDIHATNIHSADSNATIRFQRLIFRTVWKRAFRSLSHHLVPGLLRLNPRVRAGFRRLRYR
jgi:FkbM family methyltransferase